MHQEHVKNHIPQGECSCLALELLLFLFSWFFWKLQLVWCWRKPKARFLWSLWAETADAPPPSELPGLPLERKEQRVLLHLCEILLIFSQQIWSSNSQAAEEAIKNRKYGLALALFRNSISPAETGAVDNSDISYGKGLDFLGWVSCRQAVDTLRWVCKWVFTFPVLWVGNAGCIFILRNKQVPYTKYALI